MTLFLLPNLLSSESDPHFFLPQGVFEIVPQLQGLIAESEKEGRAYLKRCAGREKMVSTPIALLNEHTQPEELALLLEPLKKGESWGLISDAGIPCLSDPGAQLVRKAREKNVMIRAIVGPSAVVLALMLSGFSGERFTYHGYLPRQSEERRQAILSMEKEMYRTQSTQIFIETPHRTEVTFSTCLEVLRGESLLSLALDLSSHQEEVVVLPITAWRSKKNELSLKGRLSVFLIQSQ